VASEVGDVRELDLVRSIYAAWERGDFRSGEWVHSEIELVIADGPTPGTWTGLAGMAESTHELLGPWEELRVLPRSTAS
jgi:hypothetical protein